MSPETASKECATGETGVLRGTHMIHFIHNRVGVILRKRHRALALGRAIRRDAGVRRDLLPGGAKRYGVLLDAREEL
jgi:hypothetical protein